LSRYETYYSKQIERENRKDVQGGVAPQRPVFQEVVPLAATVFSENIPKMHKIDEIPVFRNKTFSDPMNPTR
jgi:hypothetical protein